MTKGEFMQADPEMKMKVMVDFDKGLEELEEIVETVADKESELFEEAVRRYDEDIYYEVFEEDVITDEDMMDEEDVGKYDLHMETTVDVMEGQTGAHFIFEGSKILIRNSILDLSNDMMYFVWEFCEGAQ